MLSEFLIWEAQEDIDTLAFSLRNVEVINEFGPMGKGEKYPLVFVFYDTGMVQVHSEINEGPSFVFSIKIVATKNKY